jgi:hypothetical protein
MIGIQKSQSLVLLPNFEVKQEVAVNNQKNIQKAAKKRLKLLKVR